MKFFIDTANIDEIKKGIEMGLVDGVTTNPSLLSKEKRDPQAIIKEILSIVEGPVSLEVVSTNSKEMIEESRKLASLGQNAVIKIPMTEAVSYTHLRAHETVLDLVCRLLLEKKKKTKKKTKNRISNTLKNTITQLNTRAHTTEI